MATVITNLLSAIPWIGQSLVEFIWGGFSVSNATLNRFFSLHFLIPFVIAAFAAIHLLTLHEHGSGNPLGITGNVDRLPISPYFLFKDLVTLILFLLVFTLFIIYIPNSLGQWPFIEIWWINWFILILFIEMRYMLEILYNYNKTYNVSYDSVLINWIIKTFYYHTFKVKSYYNQNNQQITKINFRFNQSNLKEDISETLRAQKIQTNWFNQWFAGLIDGDGSLIIYKNGTTSLEITVSVEDEKILRIIQNELHAGSVLPRSGVKAVRYRINKKTVMIDILNRINGYIFNSVRLLQFEKICNRFHIQPIYSNGNSIPWIIGFFDADGSINFYPHYTKNNIHYRNQLTIAIFNKYKKDLEPFKDLFGGDIYYDKKGSGGYQWKINRRDEHFNFYYHCLKYPCKSIKINRIFLIKEYYDLIDSNAFKSSPNSFLFKRWILFINRWNKKVCP